MSWTGVVKFLRDVCQTGILAVAIYYLFAFLRGTRAFQTLVGLVSVLLGLGVAVKFLGMDELGWLLSRLAPTLPVALIVVFHPELRRALAGIGEHTTSANQTSEATVDAVARAVASLSKQRIGALIAIERTASLRQYEQHGSKLEAPLVWELLATLFYPHTPMHDGGVVIRKGLIAAAGCVFPLATGQADRRSYGTRHRAAIGLTEETDALVVAVSEETGLVSLADHGTLERGFDAEELRERLRSYDGIGYYALSLNVPRDWKGQEVFLYFGAVDESAWVYLNGKPAGEHIFEKPDDWKTPFTIRIDQHIDWSKGRQGLVVRVEDSSGDGGIWKPAYLLRK